MAQTIDNRWLFNMISQFIQQKTAEEHAKGGPTGQPIAKKTLTVLTAPDQNVADQGTLAPAIKDDDPVKSRWQPTPMTLNQ